LTDIGNGEAIDEEDGEYRISEKRKSGGKS